MAFPDFCETPRFPDDIAAYLSATGPEFKTDVVTVDSGWEQRNAAWAQSLLRVQIECDALNSTQATTLMSYFRARRGRAQGFRFKDFNDYAAVKQYPTPSTVQSGPLAGPYKLQKKYYSGSDVETRRIYKPFGCNEIQTISMSGGDGGDTFTINVEGQVTSALAWNASLTTVHDALEALSTVGSGNMSVTGTAGVSYICEFEGIRGYKDRNPMVVVGTGCTPTVSETQKGHGVQVFVGPSETEYYEGADYDVDYTVGSFTFKAGHIPAEGNLLKASFEFDVPVRFDSDSFLLTYKGVNYVSGTCGLSELRMEA